MADYSRSGTISSSFDINEEDLLGKNSRSERSKSFGASDTADMYGKRNPLLPGRARNVSGLGNLHLPQILSPAPDTSLSSNTNAKGVPVLVQPAPDTSLKMQRPGVMSKSNFSGVSPGGTVHSKALSPLNNNNDNTGSIINNSSSATANNIKPKSNFKHSGLDSLSESFEVLDNDNSNTKNYLASTTVTLLKDGGNGETDA